MFHGLRDMAAARCRRGEVGISIAAALGLNGLFGGLAYLLFVHGAGRQIESAYWPTAPGVITAHQIERGVAVHGGSTDWEPVYQFVVNGIPFTGTKYAQDPLPLQGRDIERAKAAFPIGAKVTVWYNPDDPSDAVLRPGLRGGTLWVAMFIVPFLLGSLSQAVGLIDYWRGFHRFRPPVPGQTVVRLEPVGPVELFLSFFMLGTGLTIWTLMMVGYGFGVAYWLFDGFIIDPPVWGPAIVWAVVVAGCAWATRAQLKEDTAITADAVGRQLLFSSGAAAVPFADVRGVAVIDAGDGKYRVDLDRADGPLPLYTFDHRPHAEALAAWIETAVAGRGGEV